MIPNGKYAILDQKRLKKATFHGILRSPIKYDIIFVSEKILQTVFLHKYNLKIHHNVKQTQKICDFGPKTINIDLFWRHPLQ